MSTDSKLQPKAPAGKCDVQTLAHMGRLIDCRATSLMDKRQWPDIIAHFPSYLFYRPVSRPVRADGTWYYVSRLYTAYFVNTAGTSVLPRRRTIHRSINSPYSQFPDWQPPETGPAGGAKGRILLTQIELLNIWTL
jgi:hypothetical protein